MSMVEVYNMPKTKKISISSNPEMIFYKKKGGKRKGTNISSWGGFFLYISNNTSFQVLNLQR